MSEEFWSLTWREVSALSDLRRAQIRREDSRTALICHTLACLWCKDPPAFEVFMPQDKAVAQTATEPLPDEAMVAKVNAIMRTFGGVMPEEKPKGNETL